MKSFKQIVLGVILTLGAFTTVTYTACNKDECKDVVCQNGGTCSGGTCTCPTGYEGAHCDTLSRTKFVGVYVGDESCTTGTDHYSITLSAASNNLQLTYQNVYNASYVGTCTMTGSTTFSFSGTGSTGAIFSGSGTLTGNQLKVTYNISNAATGLSNSCTFTGNK
jgi:hypothetical protein